MVSNTIPLNQPTISIVATFYNNRKTAKQLIQSVLNQTYTDWELICIDDCSPSNDFEVLSKWGKKITIIRNEYNLGANKSRKKGIDLAKGKYITFIDGDDWFEPEALEHLVKPALKYDLDFCQMNSNRAYPLGIKKKCKNVVDRYNSIIQSSELIDKYYISFFGINLIGVAFWGKLIKTEIVRNTGFNYNHYPIGEDLLFNVYLFPCIKTAMFVDYHGYNWRFGGITSSKSNITKTKKLLYDFIEIFNLKKGFADKLNYSKAYIPMFIELKNILLSNFSGIAKYPCRDKKAEEIKSLIIEILNIDSSKNNILKLLSIERYQNDNFINAINKNDIDAIYQICHVRYKADWKRRIAKNILRKLL